MKRIIGLLLLLCSVLSLLGGCARRDFGLPDQMTETKSTEPRDTTGVEELVTTEGALEQPDRLITPAEIDYYSPCRESEYLSALIYDPLRDRWQTGGEKEYDKMIVATAYIGENRCFEEGVHWVFEQEDSNEYFYAVGSEELCFTVVATSNLITSTALVHAGERDEQLEIKELEGYKVVPASVMASHMIDCGAYFYDNQYDLQGDGWYTAMICFEDDALIERAWVEIGTTPEGEEIYLVVQLDEPVEPTVEAVEAALADNVSPYSYTMLEDTDDLQSVHQTLGDAVDLSQTIFYQDVIAEMVSEQYGLNLREKDYFEISDRNYVIYHAYTDDDYRTTVRFYREMKQEGLQEGAEQVFAYTDLQGNTYEYWQPTEKQSFLHTYKNGAYTGSIEVKHRGRTPQNALGELNYLFGTRE